MTERKVKYDMRKRMPFTRKELEWIYDQRVKDSTPYDDLPAAFLAKWGWQASVRQIKSAFYKIRDDYGTYGILDTNEARKEPRREKKKVVPQKLQSKRRSRAAQAQQEDDQGHRDFAHQAILADAHRDSTIPRTQELQAEQVVQSAANFMDVEIEPPTGMQEYLGQRSAALMGPSDSDLNVENAAWDESMTDFHEWAAKHEADEQWRKMNEK